jgi:spectinomycin phosphotransferase
LAVVRSRFDAVAETEIRGLIGTGWGIAVHEMREVLEGGGSHHWAAQDADGGRWFVTCDDLATKPWLGEDHDTVFRHLLAAYGTAIDLRRAGQTSVVAPIPSRSDAPAERLDERHSLAVFEHVDGAAGRWGAANTEAVHELVVVLAGLHRAITTEPTLRRHTLEVPGHAAFEAALAATNRPWGNGPFSEPARRILREHLDVITAWMHELSCAATRLAASPPSTVITHGEPHPGNLIDTEGGLRLVDWDTVALAPPERDLWMVAEVDANALDLYRQLTGDTLDQQLLTAYRLLWAVADLAAFTAQLRASHSGNADDERALQALSDILTGREPRPYGRTGGA